MKLSQFIEQLEKDIIKTSKDVQKIEELERIKETARKYEGDDAVISSEELVERIKQRPEELKLKSGFSGIDKLLDGFRLQQLITLTAATGSGKTTMAMELTIRLKEYNPMWLPFEEGAEELIAKFLERGENPPLFFTPEHIIGKTLEWVEQKIVESIAKYNTKVIFIDHLHFIVPFTSERHDLAVGRTMRELKGLAKKWNVCIFIICHLKKTQVTEKPNIDDLRDCLPAGELVYSEGKRIPVEEIKAGMPVASRLSIKRLQKDVITDIWEAGEKDIYEITTKTGRKIRCSDGHKFYATTFNKGNDKFTPNQGRGIQGWTEAKNLKIGQKVAVVKRYPDTGKKTISNGKALVIGWLIGDGHITKNGYSEMTVNTIAEANLLKYIADKEFGLDVKINPYKDKKALRVYMTGSGGENKLARFLRDNNITQSGRDKRVPSVIFDQDKDTIKYFLMGLFHADGSVNFNGYNNSISARLHTISETLARDVIHLLSRFGLISYVKHREYKNGFNGKDCDIYSVDMYSYSAKRFVNEIGFCLDKQAKAKEKADVCDPKNLDKDMDIFFDRIASIEYVGRENTYDISVKGHHKSLKNNSFCVSEFLTHNSSFIGQESDSVIMLWRATKRTTPPVINDTTRLPIRNCLLYVVE